MLPPVGKHRMKLLVFAHTPPPYHGQSYMVKLMLDGLGGDKRGAKAGDTRERTDESIECFHVNARFSGQFEEIGEAQLSKAWLILRYCAEAIWCRFRHGADHFYYVPAPGKRIALYRDWVVMLLCRPFFKKTIFHWHATGLGDWLRHEGTWIERWITHALLDGPALSIALAISSMRDSLWFKSWRVEIVPNGIPDPCPDFERKILPRRRARKEARRRLLAGESLAEPDSMSTGGDPHIFKVLYLAHCTREKGVFDSLDAVALANRDSGGSKIRMHLTVAGAFLDAAEEAEFRARIARADLAGAVTYAGFVDGVEKTRLFGESDCFCFPTYYAAEGQPVSLIEAIAFGLPVVTTRWRAIPEIIPADYSAFVPDRAPQALAAAFRSMIENAGDPAVLRAWFLSHFTDDQHIQSLRKALLHGLAESPLRPL